AEGRHEQAAADQAGDVAVQEALHLLHAAGVPVQLEGPLGNGAAATIRFSEPEYGVAPGQAAVLYAGDRVIGGGWIESTEA
ncbi:MAG: aminomethyltransferase beta-barrel domain-containing protein, partial [Novosphingobium sp.]